MFLKKFDLGNGKWLKLGLAAKCGQRIVYGLECWILKKGLAMPLLLNTAITNDPKNIRITDNIPFRIFLDEDGIRGFSSTVPMVVTHRDNGKIRIFQCLCKKEEGEGDESTVFRLEAYEKLPVEQPANLTGFNEFIKIANEQADNGTGKNGPTRRARSGNPRHWPRSRQPEAAN